MDSTTLPDRGFSRLVLATAFVTFLMITIGAITRVSESGMGCGTYWPSCNGHLIPEFENIHVVIEYGHRLFALLVGGFMIAVSVQAWQKYRHIPRIFVPSMLGIFLFFSQSGLGAITVALSNQWFSVLLHLGNAMALLAVYLVLWVNARTISDPTLIPQTKLLNLPPMEVTLTAALSFLVSIIGAAVAGNEATKACVGWPLCGGEIWPVQQGPLQLINMLHRLVAGGLGVMLILMLIQARAGVPEGLRRALNVSMILYILQAALGASVVLIDNREWLVVSRSLHVTFAAATWSAIVIASTFSWLQQLPSAVIRNNLPPRVASSATTSN